MPPNESSLVMLVTGAGSGIGRHLTGALSSRGHRLLATDVNLSALEAAAKADGWSPSAVKLCKLDIRLPAEWETAKALALQSFSRLDVLLNVAGYLKPGNSWELEASEIDKHFDINVKGLMHGTRAIGAHFVGQKSGHIINIGSLASLAPVPGLCLYSASKFAVRGFSLATAQELKLHNVFVSLVMPDAVQTPMLDLQVDFEEAALTFSGARALTVQDIEKVVIDEVLVNKPLEVALPFARAAAARLADFMPGMASRLIPLLSKKGMKAQAQLKKDRKP
jgi:3-oxoacyl-[acyl-carrier protein] reductase